MSSPPPSSCISPPTVRCPRPGVIVCVVLLGRNIKTCCCFQDQSCSSGRRARARAFSGKYQSLSLSTKLVNIVSAVEIPCDGIRCSLTGGSGRHHLDIMVFRNHHLLTRQHTHTHIHRWMGGLVVSAGAAAEDPLTCQLDAATVSILHLPSHVHLLLLLLLCRCRRNRQMIDSTDALPAGWTAAPLENVC